MFRPFKCLLLLERYSECYATFKYGTLRPRLMLPEEDVLEKIPWMKMKAEKKRKKRKENFENWGNVHFACIVRWNKRICIKNGGSFVTPKKIKTFWHEKKSWLLQETISLFCSCNFFADFQINSNRKEKKRTEKPRVFKNWLLLI